MGRPKSEHGPGSGRVSIAAKIIKDLEDVVNKEASYLVFYDWTGSTSKVFYSNLKTLQEKLGGITKVQASIYKCEGSKSASALYQLSKHFDMEVEVYEVKVTGKDPQQLYSMGIFVGMTNTNVRIVDEDELREGEPKPPA